MRNVRAILIDPFACKVTEIEHNADDYRQIYTLLSHTIHPVSCFALAPVDTLKGDDCLFVDDEGLLRGPVRWFNMAGGYQPIAGKGLILGSDEDGFVAACVTPLNLVRVSVVFAERNGSRLVMTEKPLTI